MALVLPTAIPRVRGIAIDGELADWAGQGHEVHHRQNRRPYILVAPPCPPDTDWCDAAVLEVLDDTLRDLRADPDRVILTGGSMGGFGAWKLAIAHPERWAALVPACGGGDETDVSRIAGLPVWNFHGLQDDIVAPDSSRRMMDALTPLNPRARATWCEERGHSIGDDVIRYPGLIEWMLEQSRG